MPGLIAAVAHGNFDGLHNGDLVYVDPDEWPEHFRLGILTPVSAEKLKGMGIEVPSE